MKKYQFCVSVSFDINVDFSRRELQQWPEGNEGELEPKDVVMEKLEDRLTELISSEFNLVTRIRLYTDGDLMKPITA